ncbi:MAG TPA: imidazolonepropionase [Candidatus Polarisedimenticolia bacterium]|nr:imidazolonepropionase [Candidatus Polarisedimenticolia bacterium]
MIRADLVIVDAAQLLTLAGPAPRLGHALRDLALVEGGCLAVRDGLIVFAGPRDAFESSVALDDEAEVIDAAGQVVLPGFVDAHTHLPFAGSREHEFARRLAGATYQEIAREGGGILSTVRATRAASDEELLDAVLQRMDRMLLEGITTCEAKTGYGLSVDQELRLLKLLRSAAASHPLDISPTLLGAHAVPPEHREDRARYVRMVIEEMIPAAAAGRLAEGCDVFCEEGVFSIDESRRILTAGRQAGLRPRLHADQLSAGGGAELAAELGAASADHLEHASDEGLRAMAAAGVTAVLLPGASFCMRQARWAPARRMIEAGLPVALATDLNPGTCYTQSMQLMIALGVLMMGLGVEEAISSTTINPAVTIGRSGTIGSLEVGKQADLVVLDVPSYLHLAYRPGINHVTAVIKRGKLVVRDRRIVYPEDAPAD